MLLNYKKYGNAGEVLLILHGFLGSLDNWHTLATEWSNYFTVYTLDLRNHGKSPHTEHHSIALMADDVAEFMEQQQIASAYILGHSMGGKVAMQMAFTYTNKIDKLIAYTFKDNMKTQFSNSKEELEKTKRLLNNIKESIIKNKFEKNLNSKFCQFCDYRFLCYKNG